MTMEEIKASDKLFLQPADIAEVLNVNPQDIRWQAREAPEQLGFPVVVIKTRTRIPRLPFIAFVEGREVTP